MSLIFLLMVRQSIPHKEGFIGRRSVKSRFRRKGIKTIQSDQSHHPHDSMLSKVKTHCCRTLKSSPDAIIDIHRDAAPAEEYQGNVNGKTLAKFS